MKSANVISKFLFIQLVATCLLISSISAYAAVDMFLVIDGVNGESKDDVYRDAIDVLAWSEGMSQSGSLHDSAGGGAGKASLQDITITKWLDSSSPYLRLALAQGNTYDAATLIVRKAGEERLEFFKIELGRILITSISAGGSGGEDRLTENITINFSEIKWIYTPQKANGSAEAAIETCWDVAANTSC